MIEVVGVSFKTGGKIYYFSPNNLEFKIDDEVVVETEKGIQYGFVIFPNFKISEDKIKGSLSSVLRIANNKDKHKNIDNNKDAIMALSKCRTLAKKYKLNMSIIDSYYNFDRTQLTFNFIAENRVDFRSLVKELASIYKTRIELFQIGVRDKAKQIGGCGQCGRPLCCSKFLCDFDSVSINMAKNQGIALNPNKINGACGRLLCCLKYENDCYSDLRNKLPYIGKNVTISDKKGKVVSIDVLKQTYKVEFKDREIVECVVGDEK